MNVLSRSLAASAVKRLGCRTSCSHVLYSRCFTEVPETAAPHSQLMSLLKGYSKQGDFGMAMSTFRSAQDAGETIPREVFRYVFEMHVRLSSFKKTQAFFDEMIELGQADVGAANKMLSVCVSEFPEASAAEQLLLFRCALDKMEHAKIKPDHITMNTIVSANCKKRKSPGPVLNFIEEMKKFDLEPDLVTYNTLLSFYANKNDHGGIKDTLSELKARGFKMDAVTYNTLMLFHFRSEGFNEAMGLFDEMKATGVTPSATTYTVVIATLKRRKLFSQADKEYTQMRNAGFVPDAITFTTMIGIYGVLNDPNQALHTYRDMLDNNVKPTVVTYTALLSVLSRRGLYKEADTVMQDVVASKVTLDKRACGAMLGLYCKAQHRHLAEKTFNHMIATKADISQHEFLAMMAMYKQMKEYDKVKEVYESMTRYNLKNNVETYTCMLDALSRSGDMEGAQKLFDEMCTSTSKPNAITYGNMIDAYARMDDIETCEKLFADVKAGLHVLPRGDNRTYSLPLQKGAGVSNDPPVPKHIFNVMLSLYVRTKQFAKVRAMYDDMVDHLGTPSPAACAAMMRVHLENKEYEELNKYFKGIREDGLVISQSMYMLALQSFVEVEDFDTARKLFQEAKDVPGDKPELVAAWIQALCKKGKLEAITKAVDDILASKFKLTNQLLSSAIVAFTRAKTYFGALSLFDKAKKAGLHFDEKTYAVMLILFEQKCDFIGMEKMFDEARGRGFLDQRMANVMMHGYALQQNTEKAEWLWAEMKAKGVEPSIVTYSTLLDVFRRAGDLQKAEKTFGEMRDAGLQPDIVAYGTLAALYATKHKLGAIKDLLMEMKRDGVEVNLVLYNTIMKACAAVNDREKLESVMKMIEANGLSADGTSYSYLLNAYVNHDDLSKVKETMDTVYKLNLGQIWTSWMNAIVLLCTHGEDKRAITAYEHLKSQGCIPSDQVEEAIAPVKARAASE